MSYQKSNEIKIKFGGKPNEINAKTLIKSLTSITNVIEEINNEIGEDQKLEIRIRAPKKGSFLISLNILISKAVDLITSIELGDATEIVTILIGILTLRKMLKGKEPEKTEEANNNIIVTTKSGNIITVNKPTFNIYNNNVKINECLTENFETLSSDSTINSFEIQDAKKVKLFEVTKDEFEKMSAKKIEIIPKENKRIITQQAALSTFKIVWDKTRKWEFIYRGVKISAHIVSEPFFERIRKGEHFSMGDTLEVELEIHQIFDESANTFVNESYMITKVYKHNPRSEQGSLFEE